MKRPLRLLALFAILALLASAPAAERVKVVSFSSILTEIAEQVGGDAVEVVGLVPPSVDPHEYQPTPTDLRQLADAQLILASGKHLEPYLDKLPSAAAADATLLKVGDHLPSLEVPGEAGHDHHDHGDHAGHHHHGGEDPHWWHSVAQVQRATRIVRDALIAIDPSARATFEANAAAALARLTALDKWIQQQIATLPRDRRELVTSHDAFRYFASEYGFEIHAIEGLSTEKQTSSRAVSAIIDLIKRENVRAIFLEDTANPKVSVEITRETGAKVGGTLYADGLGTEADTYEKMQRHNVTTIVEALR